MTGRWVRLAVGVLVATAGCVTTQGLDDVRPSHLLRGAYFSRVVAAPRHWGAWEASLPKRQTESDPAKDADVIFIVVFSSPGNGVSSSTLPDSLAPTLSPRGTLT